MTRFSPVREMACNAIVAGSTPARVSDRPVARKDRAAVSYTAGRRFESAQAGLVFTLWQGSANTRVLKGNRLGQCSWQAATDRESRVAIGH